MYFWPRPYLLYNKLVIHIFTWISRLYFKYNLPKMAFLVSNLPFYNHRILPHFTWSHLYASSCFAQKLWRYVWLLYFSHNPFITSCVHLHWSYPSLSHHYPLTWITAIAISYLISLFLSFPLPACIQHICRMSLLKIMSEMYFLCSRSCDEFSFCSKWKPNPLQCPLSHK